MPFHSLLFPTLWSFAHSQIQMFKSPERFTCRRVEKAARSQRTYSGKVFQFPADRINGARRHTRFRYFNSTTHIHTISHFAWRNASFVQLPDSQLRIAQLCCVRLWAEGVAASLQREANLQTILIRRYTARTCN
jgi:hypothetical protein